MSRTPLFVLLLPLLGCKKGDDTADSTPVAECQAVLEETWPAEGATDFYHRASVEFVLDLPDAEATITLTGPSGAVDGAVSRSEDAKTLYFTPTDPLDPATAYTATLTWCGGTSDLGFTTSSLGEARTASPLGSTYVVDLKQARFTDPASLASIIGMALKLKVLIAVNALEDGATIDLLGTIGKEDVEPPEQDYCGATMDFAGTDFSADPFFHLGPKDVVMALPTHDMSISGLEISGTFAADGSSFGGGVLEGQLDTRENLTLYSLMGLDATSGDSVCQTLAGLGVTCAPCDDGQPYCMDLRADSILAPMQADTPIEPVETAHCHELCDNNAEDCVL